MANKGIFVKKKLVPKLKALFLEKNQKSFLLANRFPDKNIYNLKCIFLKGHENSCDIFIFFYVKSLKIIFKLVNGQKYIYIDIKKIKCHKY